jgi:hypothetical protein
MRFLFVVRYRPRNGRDGGLGATQKFKTIAGDSHQAASKLHKPNCEVVSVRKVRAC